MARGAGTDRTTSTPAHGRASELGTILGVWAHPDDEAYLSAGLMALAVQTSARVVCATATKGELGTADPDGCPPEKLAEVRAREMAASLGLLGVTDHRWLGHADGGCADVPHEHGVEQLVALIDEVHPQTVVTFGPDGMTGHPDHISVGAWASDAARHRDVPLLLHAVMDRQLMAGLPELLADDAGVYGPGGPPLLDREEAAVVLDLPEDILDLKLAALREQESQTSSLIDTVGHDKYRRWLSIETFADGSAR